MRRVALAAACVVGGGVAMLTLPAVAQRPDPAKTAVTPLAPHRAIYEFKLGTVRSEKGVSGLSGRMVYEFSGSACDGWSQNMRFVTQTSTAGGESSVSDQRTTSWEDDAGMNYRFQTSSYRDGKLAEQSAGTATRGEGGADTKVVLTHPDPREGAVGPAVMFPVQHSLRLLDNARRGRTSFTADYFDGSEGGEKTYVISAQIGRQTPPTTNKSLPRIGQSEKLDGVPAWPVSLSYFEQGAEAKDTPPVYEMSFLFFANGVSRRLVIDNGEYTMLGELSEFTLLEQPACRQ